MTAIRIFTDGSCLGNPGPGGFAFVAVTQNVEEVVLAEHSGSEVETTNNQMELRAAIEALSAIETEDIVLKIPCEDDCKFELFTDSIYVKKGITEWIEKWKDNDWKRGKKDLKNPDLWKKLYHLNEKFKSRLSWKWVKGHSGNTWNERADKLAVAGALRARETLSGKSERNLTPSQEKALDLILQGKNVFVTGPGGCGKTFLINYFVTQYKASKNIAVTSTTGTSAIHIHGSTFHSWAGIGLGKGSVGSIATHIKKKRYLKERWLAAEILIIDEISMMSPELFDKLEKVARMVRRSTKAFGGLQLFLTGDFLQLPCIDSEKFCFEAQTWDCCIDETIYMHENLRQVDKDWQTCLDEIRLGTISPESKKLLKSLKRKKLRNKLGILPTLLFPLNVDVEEINNKFLQDKCQEKGEVLDYEMETISYNKKIKSKIEKFKKNCPAVERLSLTVGCQVMLLWNMDVEQGLVNGSRGVVTRFINDLPLVRFLDGQTRLIDYHLWEMEEEDRKFASIEQIPLRLAYALSIHKSQGCSLDYVVTDLENVFEYGQAYVALSRARKANGLQIKNLRFSKIRAHPTAKAYYESLKPN